MARGLDHEQVLAREEGVHDLALAGAEGGEAEALAEDGLDVVLHGRL
ncbi:MAG: hypothetical protein R3F59_13340 [Myxococcota bacterium]